MEVIRQAADPKCASHLENSISSIDAVLAIPGMRTILKGLFGLADLQHDEDFASVLEVCSPSLPLLLPNVLTVDPIYIFFDAQIPLGSWQEKNWDPTVGSTKFDEFCEALGKRPYGVTEESAKSPFGDRTRMITLPGGLSLDFTVLNYAKYIKDVSGAESRCRQLINVTIHTALCGQLFRRVDRG